MSLSYDVSYRLLGETGLARTAVVVISVMEGHISHESITKALARVHAVSLDKVIDMYPVLLPVGSVLIYR